MAIQLPADTPAQLSDLESVFSNVIEIVLGAGGVALFIMLIIGGFKYIFASGDPQQTAAAQKTLTYAIGGLILILVAYLVLRLIADLTGAQTLLKFQIVQP